MELQIAISPGELIDRITILDIKRLRIADVERRRQVTEVYESLLKTLSARVPASPPLAALTTRLKAINEALWQAEEDLRGHEQRQLFDERFVETARSVYVNNDRRSELKQQINQLLGSSFVEEKIYACRQAR